MPEIKNTFTQGKMNQDLDERIVPNGQYIDAMNIKVTSSDDASVGVVQNILGNYRVENVIPPNSGYMCIATIADEKTNKLYWFVTQEPSSTHAILEYDLTSERTKMVLVDKKNDTLKFTQNIITGVNIIDNLLFWTDNYSEPKKINIDDCIKGTKEANPTVTNLDNASHTKLLINGIDKGDISEKHITVIKQSPKQPPLIKINKPTDENPPKLFEQVFPRFSFRYKYKDGEYSSFGPFTQVVFNPVYVSGENGYGREDAYSTKDSYNLAMVNQIKSIDISNFVSSSIPEGVTQVEILYKEDGSSVVFSIKTIDYDDTEWTANTYTLESEAIFAAIPSNQFLRPWDNVPKKALAQEITGNRIVYGNYTQGYNLLAWNNFKVGNKINASFGLRENNSTFSLGGLPSLKTQRNYQVGFVWGDKYGRETPVFTSEEAGVNIPWYDNTFGLLASKSLFLKTNLATYIPTWANYYKVYVKETSGDYYNLLMEKAYPQSHMNVFDFEEDRIWLAFPSADRNKVTEDDYLIFKKQLIGSHEQIPLENKFKILDIQNEAPDAIKFEYTSLGKATQTSDNTTSNDYLTRTADGLMKNSEFRIDQTVDMVYVDKGEWLNALGGASLSPDNDNDELHVTDLYIYWTSGGSESSRYKVVGINVLTDTYRLKLQKPIETVDAELADINSVANDIANGLKADVQFFIDRKDEKDVDEFSGKFFVQIVYKIPTAPSVVSADSPTIISSQAESRWFYDPAISSAGGTGSGGAPVDSDGVINVNLSVTPPTEDSSEVTLGSGSTTDIGEWEALATELDSTNKRGFFIDNMYMVAGQPFNDNASITNAKLSGKTWIGWMESGADQIPKWILLNNGDYGWSAGGSGELITSSYNPRAWASNGNISKDETKAMNGLEGFLTTQTEHVGDTTLGPTVAGFRRWRGISGYAGKPLYGLGDDTYGFLDDGTHTMFPNTYGDVNQVGRHFIHLSFLAPGEDLHDGVWTLSNGTAELNGVNSVGNHMQAIWGGGVFTNGVDILEMEGNYDPTTGDALVGVPGPGTGQGYDLGPNNIYRDKNENQWNPAWPPSKDPDGKIQEFIDNIIDGATFHFSSKPEEKFTIIGDKKEKRIYNHTPWIAQYKWDGSTPNPTANGGLVLCQNSVDEAASAWLTDTSDETKFEVAYSGSLQDKITDFGRANNRRVVYIFEVDRNPASVAGVADNTTDFDSNSPLDIVFTSSSPNVLLKDLVKGTAIWETEAKPGEELDLYYEASQAIPIRLTDETNELFAPIGSRIEILLDEARNGKHTISSDVFLESWGGANGRTITLTGDGFNKFEAGGSTEIIYADNSDPNAAISTQIRFFREDGSYTTTRIVEEGDRVTDYVNTFILDPTLDASMEVGLSYFNCYSFGNGVESNRIRDDFNAPSISKGVKASLVLDQEYKEENRKNGLIYSGIYNSTSGINNLNQFIMAENITKDLNPTYGSIQKLFQRRISLVAFCEDRVVSITSNKDALFNADGNSQLVSTNNVLGDATPFVGDFGISKNPESFAKESYRAYFTDKQRGAVLRLSMDGITPISDAGMDDYFRDNLKLSGEILGSYDGHSKNYNVTLRNHKPGENIITNNSINLGVGAGLDPTQTPVDIIIDGDISGYNDVVLGTTLIDVSTNIYDNDVINVETTITNYDEIGIGDLIQETETITTTTISNTAFTTDDSNPSFYYGSYADDATSNPFEPGQDDFKLGVTTTQGGFHTQYANYQYPTAYVAPPLTPPHGSSSNLFWNAAISSGFLGVSGDLFWNPEIDSYTTSNNNSIAANPGGYNGGSASSDQPWFFEANANSTTGQSTNVGRGIVFDGTSGTTSIGNSLIVPGTPTYSSPQSVPTQVLTQYSGADDNTIFNGEEVKLRFYFRNAVDFNFLGGTAPHNRKINIQLYDGTTALGNSVLLDPSSTTLTDTNYSTYQITSPNSGTYEVGYATTSSYTFAEMINDTDHLHEIYFKFTDGTENEGIVVQDLQVHISMLGGSGHSGFCLGSISSLNIRKVFELTSALDETTTTTQDGNPVPDAPIPAFATVAHTIPDWYLTNFSGLSLTAHSYAKEAKIIYGDDFSDLTTYTLTQSGSGATAPYVFPTSGNVSNGSVVYDDGSGGQGMYATGKYLTDDLLSFSNEVDGVKIQQSVAVTSGDWYFADLIYDNYVAGSDIAIDSDGASSGVKFNVVNTGLYGVNQDVLRVIFQIDSEQETAGLIKIAIPNDVKIEIQEFKLVRINGVYTGGDITHWNFDPDPNPPNHSFDTPSIYGSDQGIQFEVASGDSQRYVYQNFTTSPTLTPDGYRLEFEISNYASGSLDMYTIGEDASSTSEGITVEDIINANGNYSIDFNFDNNSYDLKNNSTVVGATTPVSQHATAMTDLVIFKSDSSDGFIGCVTNISLIDQTNYFTGATVGDFNISGFDQQLNTYIDFQETPAGDGQIVFTDSPTTGDIGQVQIEQLIDKDINQNETYRLNFDYDITSGAIGVYYFSSLDNKGFYVEGLSGLNQKYNVLHVVNEDYVVGLLKDTLVFFVSENDTSGTIDNVILRQEFVAAENSTISFSENVRGWVSKKSFIPEQGASVSSEYFTMESGRLYKHNSKLEPRNTFYGDYKPSTITAVLNESPSSVKIFNTLNYEGSQSKVVAGDSNVLIGGNNYNTLQTYNLTKEDGWSVDYIKTDKQEGVLDEFVEKEGKWFNYIKGLSTDIKTSDLSFQGLGIVKIINL